MSAMRRARKAKGGEGASASDRARSGRRLASWIAALIAVIGTLVGLVTNVDTLGNLVTDRAQQRALYAQLLDTSARQLKDGKYEQAWSSTEKAVEVREGEGWKLLGLASLDDVLAMQADIAMSWLRDIRLVGEGKTFTSVVERIEPALHREEGKADKISKADIVAHLGYADFLRRREGDGGADPEPRYREALELDENNPYANAMLGHWLLWSGGRLDAARELFDKALASGREHDFVRHFQLAAFRNARSDDAEIALLQVANDMRKSGESADEDTRSAIDGIYYFAARSPDDVDRLIRALPPNEHLATMRWLFSEEVEEDKRIRHEYYQALLEEAAGDYTTARQHFLALKPRVSDMIYRSGVASALQRLARR